MYPIGSRSNFENFRMENNNNTTQKSLPKLASDLLDDVMKTSKKFRRISGLSIERIATKISRSLPNDIPTKIQLLTQMHENLDQRREDFLINQDSYNMLSSCILTIKDTLSTSTTPLVSSPTPTMPITPPNIQSNIERFNL